MDQLIFSLEIYLIPTWISLYRKHPNVLPIVVVNIFLGWTIIGWIVAFIWPIIAIDTTRKYR